MLKETSAPNEFHPDIHGLDGLSSTIAPNFEMEASALNPDDVVTLQSGSIALLDLEVNSELLMGKGLAPATDNFADETCIPTCTGCPTFTRFCDE